jgi:hypothetical protein
MPGTQPVPQRWPACRLVSWEPRHHQWFSGGAAAGRQRQRDGDAAANFGKDPLSGPDPRPHTGTSQPGRAGAQHDHPGMAARRPHVFGADRASTSRKRKSRREAGVMSPTCLQVQPIPSAAASPAPGAALGLGIALITSGTWSCRDVMHDVTPSSRPARWRPISWNCGLADACRRPGGPPRQSPYWLCPPGSAGQWPEAVGAGHADLFAASGLQRLVAVDVQCHPGRLFCHAGGASERGGALAEAVRPLIPPNTVVVAPDLGR